MISSQFEIETLALHYICAIGNYHHAAVANRAAHRSIVESAIHFWRAKEKFSDLVGHIVYRENGKLPTYHPQWKNAMNNISQAPSKVRLFRQAPGISGKKMMLQPEQNPVNWMMDVVLKFCEAGELAVYSYVGTLATLKACLLLPQNFRIVRCEKDSMGFVKPPLSLAGVFLDML